MKAKYVNNFLNEQNVEEIVTSDEPSRYINFVDDMSEWLKGADYQAKENAIDTYHFFKGVRDYVQAMFADKMEFDDLKSFRENTFELWRVGPPQGYSSFFTNKEASESYAKRMGVHEPERYYAKGKDIIPTLAGSGEVVVDEEDLIR